MARQAVKIFFLFTKHSVYSQLLAQTPIILTELNHIHRSIYIVSSGPVQFQFKSKRKTEK